MSVARASAPVSAPPADTGLRLSDWIGRQESMQGCVPPSVAGTIHATLGQSDDAAPVEGEALPPLWHWYAFPPAVPMDGLAEDGHPRLGGFLPPVPRSRRMWASGQLEFYADLRVGERMDKSSTITAVEEKSGAAGPMVFVVVEHELRGAAGLAVRETQSIVYLPFAPTFKPPPKRPAPTENLVIDRHQPVSTALLFRYSAITFNAHRIHYDLPYARDVEHYPGLVVHGPLQANLLIAQAMRWKGRRPDSFSFRGVHPMFHDSDLRLCATHGAGGSLDMCTVAAAGHMGMTATADWED
ncbi:acyl dehydratase [Meridianimarinicoccus roseus]|uniref:Acyl dehydratase n=1 Tax=Meridianimarinicoccus roseus TaxID=2072018 RepID=A0A2V2LFT6_9RHOB|nr:MaoC family dehydratase N-terminal domain-containing protein [Meridianimarinicoccus roseus]PWR04490.1 acyl dehydratase [Meridianimarinicoccus roseus]